MGKLLIAPVLVATMLMRAAPAKGADSSSPDPTQAIPGVPRIPSAGLGRPTPPAVKQKDTSGISGSFGGSALFEKVHEDYFATIALFNQTTIGPVTFGVWVPLRFRVIDRDPQDDGVFRGEDWDEVSDYARVLRFVELNLGGDSWRFRGRYGALDGESIGHSTIVAGYFNSLDQNHYQAGLLFDTAIKWGGVEFMLDNLFGPEIFAFRLHSRPAAFFTDNKWANKLVVGLSVASDTNAPVVLVDNEPPATPPATTAPGDGNADVDGEGNFIIPDSAGVTIVGFDLEYALLQNKLLELVPYIDLNFLADEDTGAGFHLGAFFNIYIPTPIGPTLLTRLEYRAIGDGYAPRYVDSLYEAQRLQYGGGLVDRTSNLPLTKLGWLRDPNNGTGAHGWLGELFFDFAGWVKIGGTYEDYIGPNNAALTLSLHLPKFSFAQLGAYYTRRGFDDLSEAFDLDGALLIAYVRAAVYGPVALTAVYSRSWRYEDGSYASQSDFSVGVGLAFGY